ncbi:MAG: ABC transporter substrate-binding protein [Cyanobacteria bacterium P01_A01_bin.84]
MSYCINPNCKQSYNPDDIDLCMSCGTSLIINSHYRANKSIMRNESVCTEIFEIKDISSNDSNAKMILKIIYDDDVEIDGEKKFTALTRLFQREQDFLVSGHKNSGIPLGYDKFSFPLSDGKQVHCLVMEKVKGINLEQWVESNGPITQERALRWFKQIVDILDFIHEEKDFFHRDIKPSNIMRRQTDQKLVLIDFGTVKETCFNQYGTRITTQIGTPGYQPPEQSFGQAEKKSDFYALGRTFVYLLTGRQPRQMEMEGTIFRWYEQVFYPISPLLIKLINDLMEGDITKRPEDTRNLLARLDHIQEEIEKSLPFIPQEITSSNPSNPPQNIPYQYNNGGYVNPSNPPQYSNNGYVNPSNPPQYNNGGYVNPSNPPQYNNNGYVNPSNPPQSNPPRYKKFLERNWSVKNIAIACGALVALSAIFTLIIRSTQSSQITSTESENTGIANSSPCNLQPGDSISCGEESLVSLNGQIKAPPQEKIQGMREMGKGNYRSAEKLFSKAFSRTYKDGMPDPETLIYQNNARVLNLIARGDISPRQVRTIAVAAPLRNIQQDQEADISNQALEMLRGVAQAQYLAIKRRIYLKVAIANDANDKNKAPEIAEQLGKNKGILGVVGHYSSSIVKEVLPKYQQNGLALVSPASTSVGLSGEKNLYRIAPSDAVAGRDIGEFMSSWQKPQKVGIFWSRGESFSESLKSEVERNLGDNKTINDSVPDREIFNLASNSFNAEKALNEAKKQGMSAIVLIPDGGQTKALSNAYKIIQANQDPKMHFLAADTLYRSKTITDVGEKAARNQLKVAVAWHPFNNKQFSKNADSFWKTSNVSWLTATAYDATRVLAQTVREDPTRKGVNQILSNNDFKSARNATGKIKFNGSDRANPKVTLVKVLSKCQGSGYGFVPINFRGECIE